MAFFKQGKSVNWTYDCTESAEHDRYPVRHSQEFTFEGEWYVFEFILHEDEEPRHSRLTLLPAGGSGQQRRLTQPFDLIVLVWVDRSLNPRPMTCTELARETVSEVLWTPDYEEELMRGHVTVGWGYDHFAWFQVSFTFIFQSQLIGCPALEQRSHIFGSSENDISDNSSANSPTTKDWQKNCQQNVSGNVDSSTQTYCALGTSSDSDFPSNLESLSLDMANLLKSKTLPDVKLKCRGNHTIPAHRSVLAARSDVFSAMFRNKMEESRSGEVDLRDVEDDVLNPFLQYVYSGQIPSGVSDEVVPGMYALADKYAVHALRETCRERIVGHLTEENCINYLTLADAHGDAILKISVMDFICSHEAVLKGDTWREFTKNLSSLVVEVYHHFVESKTTGSQRGASPE